MAPLDFSDKVNLWSMIGTWLGTLFTLFGLVAVITQLRALLKDFSDDRKERLKNAAGDYAICIPTLQRSDVGLVEGKAPSLRSWINYYYHHDKDILVTPYERDLKGGQSSWSKLFARLRIQPQELIDLGGADSKYEMIASSNWGMGRFPTQMDLLIDGAKVSFGMHGDEFSALLILSGISPSEFNPKESSCAVSHLGYFYIGPRDAFSQIAQFDGSTNNLKNAQNFDATGRFARTLNVRRCIDLALGILRFDCAGRPKVLVVGSHDWNMSAAKLVNVRRNLTHLTGGAPELDPLYDIASISFSYSRDIGDRKIEWQIPLPDPNGSPYFISETSGTLENHFKTAFALSSLKPWGLFCVASRDLIAFMSPLLEKLFENATYDLPGLAVPLLIQKFRQLPEKINVDIPGWTKFSMDEALDSLKEISTHGFHNLSSRNVLYYDSMIVLFRHHNISLETAQIGMAAYCTTLHAFPPLDTSNLDSGRSTLWHEQFRSFLRERLNSKPVDEPPSGRSRYWHNTSLRGSEAPILSRTIFGRTTVDGYSWADTPVLG